MKMYKYPKIGQFRNVLSDIKRDSDTNTLKEIRFTGTTKVHGTNAAVAYDFRTGGFWAQSRNNIITPESDNAGFARWVHDNKEQWIEWFKNTTTIDGVAIAFGEWFGPGIQKGVAVSQLENKHFMIFDIKMDLGDEKDHWVHPNALIAFGTPSIPEVVNAYHMDQFFIIVDMDMPTKCLGLVKDMVDAVENECPIGRELGVTGENTTGEGIVFKYYHSGKLFCFKAKGQKHSVSKVKKVASVDVDKLNSIQEFVDYTVTENRLEQGIQEVFGDSAPDVKQTGDFMHWIIGDIMSEESDTMEQNGLKPKEVNKYISNRARTWFMEKVGNYV